MRLLNIYAVVFLLTFIASSVVALGEQELVMVGEDSHMGQIYHMRVTNDKRSDDEVFWTMESSYDGGQNWFTTMEMIFHRKSS